MARTLAVCVAGLVALCGPVCPASACEYTVRDVGFVQLETAPYHLYVYVGKDTRPEVVSLFKTAARASLNDSNVAFTLVDVDANEDHPAMRHLQRSGLKSLPTAILVSALGHSLTIPLSAEGRPLEETAWSALDGIVSSRKRDEIAERLVEAYGLVLLIEGSDRAANERAQQTALAAIAAIKAVMGSAPGAPQAPPQLMVIGAELFAAERVLLWSLGLDPQAVPEPAVAVLYGRGRRVGPLMIGAQIEPGRLGRILSLMSASCECGLDRSWLLGTMIPLRWDARTQAKVARSLDFDPENPVVKAEIARIISAGPSEQPEQYGLTEADRAVQRDPIGGYYEQRIEHADGAQMTTLSPSQMQQLSAQDLHPPPAPVGERAAIAGSPILPPLLAVAAALALLALAGGAWILWRAGGDAS